MCSISVHRSLWRNNIGDQGASAIGDALKVNGALTTLWLTNNKIGDQGASAIGEALKFNGALTSIDVGYNNLTEEVALSFVRIEKQRNKLATLGLCQCNISPTGATEIAEWILVSGALTELLRVE